ncbi:Protein GVQW1 [Plecturocebus cupreus]
MGFHYVGQAGLELLTSDDLPTSGSQSAEIIGVSHCAHPNVFIEMSRVTACLQGMKDLLKTSRCAEPRGPPSPPSAAARLCLLAVWSSCWEVAAPSPLSEDFDNIFLMAPHYIPVPGASLQALNELFLAVSTVSV